MTDAAEPEVLHDLADRIATITFNRPERQNTISGPMLKAFAANAPLAVQAAKRMMRMGMNENFNDHVHHVFLQLLPLFKSADFREGMAAFMQRRPPEFKGR